ncbi:conserved hypothetical protein [Rhodococcus sp. RD6.2]|jgi:hypothetical protein|nr:conserved hypothetical protein [Rhodococcus sp. RD6.2]
MLQELLKAMFPLVMGIAGPLGGSIDGLNTMSSTYSSEG